MKTKTVTAVDKQGIDVISLADLERDHSGLVRSIFGENPSDYPCIIQYPRPFSPNEGWKALLLHGTIDTWDFESLLSENYWRTSPVGIVEPVNYYSMFLAAVWQLGGEVMYATQSAYLSDADLVAFGSPSTDKRPVSRFRPQANNIRDSRSFQQFKAGQFSQVLFDQTGLWGVVDFLDCEMSILMATPHAYEIFVKSFGGMDAIRRRYAAWVHHDGLFGNGLAELDFRSLTPRQLRKYEKTVASYRPLFDEVGWPWPFPDHIGKEPYEG